MPETQTEVNVLKGNKKESGPMKAKKPAEDLAVPQWPLQWILGFYSAILQI